MAVFKRVDHVVNDCVISQPGWESQVVSPKRRRVSILHKSRNGQSTILHSLEQINHCLIVMHQFRQCSEDGPRFLLRMVMPVVDDVILSLWSEFVLIHHCLECDCRKVIVYVDIIAITIIYFKFRWLLDITHWILFIVFEEVLSNCFDFIPCSLLTLTSDKSLLDTQVIYV